jgi:folate-binding protein YgfZ
MSEPLGWATIAAHGEDAVTFLEGQLTQAVAPNLDGAWSALLDPSGAVVTVLWLRSGEVAGDVDLLVPAQRAPDAVARLRRFLLRVRCEVETHDGATDAPLASTDDLYERRWPFDLECARGLVPHGFGRSFVDATVSFTKGCYTGQELVARMQSRGATTPWRLVRAVGPTRDAIESAITTAGPSGSSGTTRSRDVGSAVEALGVAHRTTVVADRDDEVEVEFVA